MPTEYSALLASILYEDVKKELRRTQADEVDMQNILAKAIDCCRQAAGSFRLSGCDASGAPGAVAGHSGAVSRRHRKLSFRSQPSLRLEILIWTTWIISFLTPSGPISSCKVSSSPDICP